MSGVIPASALLAMTAGWIVGWLAYVIGRRFARGSILIATLAGLGVATISFVPAFIWLEKVSTTTLIAMDASEGERQLSWLGIPVNTTSDFCYRRSSVGVSVLADFQIDEADFLNWMSSQKWIVVPFDLGPDEWSIAVKGGAVTTTNSEVYPVRQYESRTKFKVKRGYCYFWGKPDNPDNTIKIVYDRDSNRAYVEHTTY